jgi:ferredoxin
MGWKQAMQGWGSAKPALASSQSGFHMVVSLAFMRPSNLMRVSSPLLNIFFASSGAGAIAKIRTSGKPRARRRHARGVLLEAPADFDACLECGRCQDVCPAYLSGSALNPKRVIVKLKRYMLDRDTRPLHGEVIHADELWACTTCMACVQECPARIDIVDTIIDLRRYLTLSEGTLPSTAPLSLQNIERAGNPWGLAPTERLGWAQGWTAHHGGRSAGGTSTGWAARPL